MNCAFTPITYSVPRLQRGAFQGRSCVGGHLIGRLCAYMFKSYTRRGWFVSMLVLATGRSQASAGRLKVDGFASEAAFI